MAEILEEGGSTSSAVDLSAIEQQKENIAPLAAGRSAKTLHTLFTQDRKTLNDELKAGHDRFNAEIDQVEKEGADDPLDVYHRYVRWTLASYPTGPSHASHLVPLLERATRRFVHEEQYRADIRLLKLWLLYAKYVESPRDIFRFLEGRQVGIKLSSFYEEWAMLEEQANNFPAADAIFTLGIARRAQPYERLKKRREAFQARMLLPRSQTPPQDSLSASTSSIRPVLGSSSSASIATTGQFRGTAISNATSRKALPNNGAAGFAVFKDDEAAAPTEGQEGWTDLGTNASRRKENIREAVPWKGETIPMQSDPALSRSQGARIEVFRDEDADAPTTKPDRGSNDIGESALKRSLRAPAEAELLRKDPFRNYGGPVELSEIPDVSSIPASALIDRSASTSSKSAGEKSRAPAPLSARSASQSSSQGKSKTAAPGSSTTAVKKEKVASPLHRIYPDGVSGPEYSIEELRAMRLHFRDLRSGSCLSQDPASAEDWYREARTHGTSYRFDKQGSVLLRDPESGVALFSYLAKQDEAEQEAKLAKRKAEKREGEERARRAAEAEKQRLQEEADQARQKEEQRQLRIREEEARKRKLAEEARQAAEREAVAAREAEERKRQELEEEQRRRHAAQEAERERIRQEEEAHQAAEQQERESQRHIQLQLEREEEARLQALEAERQYELELQRQREAHDQQRIKEEQQAAERAAAFSRPPSPTINTKAALAEVNAMFARTMRFDGDNDQDNDSDTEESSDEEDGFEQELETPLVPSQAETEDTFWSHSQQSQSQPPFASQRSSMGPSQASTVGFGESEGSTTEESESEQEQIQPQPYQGQTMSRSSSTSSTSSAGFSFSQSQSEPVRSQENSSRPAFKPTPQPFVPRKPASGSAIIDENASSGPSSVARPAFRPTRTPLGAKPLAISQPAFKVFSEPAVEEKAAQTAPERLAVYADDEEATEESEPESAAGEIVQSSGYAMGRRPAGANRFASMMDVMTPITERTCEFGMATTTRNLEQGMPEVRAWQVHADSSLADLDGVEDLASSRGSNWEAGRRQLELIEEEEEASRHERSRTGSEDRSNNSTLTDHTASSSQTAIASSPKSSNLPIPCDPLTPALIERFTSDLAFPLANLPGFRDHRNSRAHKLDGLQKTAKSRRKSGGANASRSSSAYEDGPAWTLELGDEDAFSVREKLGEGGYGAVFRVAELQGTETTIEDEEEEQVQTALKVESPGNIWEFYILSLLHQRLDERTRRSFVRARRVYAYQDESHLLLDYCDQGSLLDAVNHASEAGIGPAGASGQGFEEVLAVFFTIELTRTLEGLHEAGFLHGDFKIDNCLLRLEDPPGGAVRGWSSSYARDGSAGWASKGIKMIDFGRTINLNAFPYSQTFNPKWTTDKHDCAEVKAGKPWTYQPDYYGLACIAHVLLFGKYLETSISMREDGEERCIAKEPLKRYHQAALWTPFFDLLLNPTKIRKDGSLPLTRELASIRGEMESWLELNSDKAGKNLKSLLKKLEIQALAGRR